MGREVHEPPGPDMSIPAPDVPEGKEGYTGYGEIRGELRNMYGGDVDQISDFGPNTSELEKAVWYNYSLKSEYPPMITSAQENNRIWQEMEIERMLDYHPPHEVYPTELPNYHFWPSIQNELHHKKKNQKKGPSNIDKHHQDATDIPRFHRTGIPKTPLQEQNWYIPLQKDGKFNWRENIEKNGYTASLFSHNGWNRRFEIQLNTANMPFFIVGARQFTQTPTLFRWGERGLGKRILRYMYGSWIDRSMVFFMLYFGSLMILGGSAKHWRVLNWDHEPYNYDINMAVNVYKKGGYHGII